MMLRKEYTVQRSENGIQFFVLDKEGRIEKVKYSQKDCEKYIKELRGK